MKIFTARLTTAGWQPCVSINGGPCVQLTADSGSLEWCCRYIESQSGGPVTIHITTTKESKS